MRVQPKENEVWIGLCSACTLIKRSLWLWNGIRVIMSYNWICCLRNVSSMSSIFPEISSIQNRLQLDTFSVYLPIKPFCRVLTVLTDCWQLTVTGRHRVQLSRLCQDDVREVREPGVTFALEVLHAYIAYIGQCHSAIRAYHAGF